MKVCVGMQWLTNSNENQKIYLFDLSEIVLIDPEAYSKSYHRN